MMPPGLERYDWPPPPRVNWMLEGHEDAERTLRRAFEAGRLAHAWLIAGPRGIGKATLAYRFARFVLAGGGAGGGGLFAAGSAQDLAVERGYDEKQERRRSEISVDDVRAVGGFLRLTPAAGGWRVVVIDSADEM